MATLLETNIASANSWLEDEIPFGMAYLHGLLLLVSGSVVDWHRLGQDTWDRDWDSQWISNGIAFNL